VRVEIFGLPELEAGLAALAGRVQGRDMLNDVGAALTENVRMSFVMGASPYGVKWLPLKFRRGDPLRDTDRLMNSITYRVAADGVEVGTNVPYAGVHQFGYSVIKARFGSKQARRGARIPARPFFPNAAQGLPVAWEREVTDIVARAIAARIAGGGG
jgi:phage virion morphogenesis protein